MHVQNLVSKYIYLKQRDSFVQNLQSTQLNFNNSIRFEFRLIHNDKSYKICKNKISIKLMT